MIRSIFLYGELENKFGREHRLDVACPAEAVRALMVLYPEFRASINTRGHYRIVCGKNEQTGVSLGREELGFRLGASPLHIVPVLEGAANSSKGTVKLVVGVIIIAAAIYFSGGTAAAASGGFAAGLGAATPIGLSYGAVAMIGFTVALGGASMLLAQSPKVDRGDINDRSPADERASFLFNGPMNVGEQGNAVGLAYGRVRIGSVVISSSLRTEELAGTTEVVNSTTFGTSVGLTGTVDSGSK